MPAMAWRFKSSRVHHLQYPPLPLHLFMKEKNVRSIAWFVTLVIFFPLWIASQAFLDFILRLTKEHWDIAWPAWFTGILSILVFGGVLLGLAYRTAAIMHRKYPDSPPRDAAWDRQGC